MEPSPSNASRAGALLASATLCALLLSGAAAFLTYAGAQRLARASDAVRDAQQRSIGGSLEVVRHAPPISSANIWMSAGMTAAGNLLLLALLLVEKRRHLRLEDQSLRDSLTGLFNRHFMEIALDRELHRAARQRSSLAVFMLDVDHFKRFNDTFGHEAGDTVLREIAAVFSGAVRTEDIACRYGGEEFVMILPEIPRSTAQDRAESIRRAVSELRLRLDAGSIRKVTISIGVAMYPENGESARALLRVADRHLYTAKRLGRNRVFLGEPGASLSSVPAQNHPTGSMASSSPPVALTGTRKDG